MPDDVFGNFVVSEFSLTHAATPIGRQHPGTSLRCDGELGDRNARQCDHVPGSVGSSGQLDRGATAVVGLSIALPMVAIGEVGRRIGDASRRLAPPFPVDVPVATIGPAPDDALKR